MKSIRYCALLAIVALCNLVNISAQGQGRGNFDPAQMRERMMTRVREEMDVKDDAEWKLISDRVTKVMDAQRGARQNAGMAMLFRRPPGGDQNGGDGNGGNGGRRRGGGGRGFGGEPSPEAEALQKALESKASADDVKAALAKYRDARKSSLEKLEKAQEDLKKVLSSRQEAAAVMVGLLD